MHDEIYLDDNVLLVEDDIIGEDTWKILVVDDDRDIHEATEFALNHVKIRGKKIKFIHAYTGREAVDIVNTTTDIDLMLLDAIMESPYAGEFCACTVRNVMRRRTPIIIMRSGFAFNEMTLKEDCIDDFIHKSEASRGVLVNLLEKWLPYE